MEEMSNEQFTDYDVLYENLLPKFKSYEIPLMTITEVRDLLHDYLRPAIVRFYVCKKDLSNRDDIRERFNCQLNDDEIEILSNYMLLEYIDSNYIRTPSLLKVNLSSSDFNAFSPANLLDKMLQMQEKYNSENELLLSRYAWKSDGKIFSFGKKINRGGGFR